MNSGLVASLTLRRCREVLARCGNPAIVWGRETVVPRATLVGPGFRCCHEPTGMLC